MENGIYESTAAVEPQPELETRQHLLGRIGTTIRNGYERARDNVKTYAAIGTASLSLAGAELATNPEPVAAGQTSSITQQCIDEGLKPAKILSAELARPGRDGQFYFLKSHYDGMRIDDSLEPCKDRVLRVISFKTEMQDPYNHSRWVNGDRPHWQFVYGGNQGGVALRIAIPNHQGRAAFYRPTPGKGVTHVRYKERIQIKSAQSRHLLAQAIHTHPVRVDGGMR